MNACPDCLRRTDLLRELSPAIDRRFRGRRPSGLLTLDDEELVRTLTGPESGGGLPPRPVSDDELLRRSADHARDLGVTAICRHDGAYPRKLLELADPPAVLHVLGGIPRLHATLGADEQRPTVAIVGARQAPAEARALAERFAATLAAAGVTVVSGMAFGIDAAAHVGAVRGAAAAGSDDGATLAVLAGGPERSSPARHRLLHARIARVGAVVSELAPGTTPRPWSFPARNRLIAALADVIVVVAAAARSGSLSTAHFALDLDRPVGIVPGAVGSPAFAGSNRLLRDEPGTAVVLDPDDVRGLLGDRGGQLVIGVPVDRLVGLDGAARRIGERLLDGPRTIEQLLADDDPVELLGCLAELEARGRLRRELDGGIRLLAPPDPEPPSGEGAAEGTEFAPSGSGSGSLGGP